MSGSSPLSGLPSRYAFLASGRWVRTIAVGILVSLACTGLGIWQWNRHTTRLEAVALVDANYDAEPVQLDELLPRPGAPLAAQDVWRPVTVTGTYAPGGTVLLRNRPVDGSPALHVISPLLVETPDGTRSVLLVDRGWLPAGSEEVPGAVPQPPPGPVEVVVRLRPVERSTLRTPPAGQAYAIEPRHVLRQGHVADEVLGLPAAAAFGVLAQETPAPGAAPFPLPRPDTDLGTHLSYTFQWWVFALGALVGVGVLARREAAGPQEQPTASVRGRRRTAEQDEDALVDAQLASNPRGALEPTRGWTDTTGR